jgi:putative transposase
VFDMPWLDGDGATRANVGVFVNLAHACMVKKSVMKDNNWLRLLTYVTGLVSQELLVQNEYLAAENRILGAHLPVRLRLSNRERSTLAEIGRRLGRNALAQVAQVANKFDGSKYRSYPGHPRIAAELEALILKMAKETRAGDTIGL